MTIVQRVSGSSGQAPQPGSPVHWMVLTLRTVSRGERVQIAGTSYQGVTLSEIGAGCYGMVRVAVKGRPRRMGAGA